MLQARPASGWPLSAVVVVLILFAGVSMQAKRFRLIRDEHAARQINQQDQIQAQESSSSQMMLVKPVGFSAQAEKLHKFAYDISLSKRIREQSIAKEKERRKNNKLIKMQQQQDNNKLKKRTTKVPSLFFDDDDDDANGNDNAGDNIDDSIEQEPNHQQQTTTLTTDKLLIVYDKRLRQPQPTAVNSNDNKSNTHNSNIDNNNNQGLITATEKYLPQVQTTLDSQQHRQSYQHHHHTHHEAPSHQTVVQPSYMDTDARTKDESDHATRPEISLKPILLTSGIKVRSELNFARQDDNSNNAAVKNLAGSSVLNNNVVVDKKKKTTTNGAIGNQMIGLNDDDDERQEQRTKLRRTTEMAPTRLIFGLNDENLPPELSLRYKQPQVTKSQQVVSSVAADNRIGQLKRGGDKSRDELDESDYPQAEDSDWLPPWKRTSSSQIRAGTKNQLAQTSSSAIRVVASDDSVPLVINNRGLITAAKPSMPLRNKWQLLQSSPKPNRKPSLQISPSRPVQQQVVNRPVATFASITEAPLQTFTNSTISHTLLDDLTSTLAVLTPEPERNASIVSDPSSEQSWSFLPNPPYKHLSNVTTTTSSSPTAETVETTKPMTTEPTTTTTTALSKRKETTTTRRPTWMDLSSSSTNHHQHVTTAGGGDTLSSTAAYDQQSVASNEVSPPINNQTTMSKKPVQSYLRHKLHSILKQKLINSNRKQAAIADASSNSTNVIKHFQQPMPTPPPLLSSTVANNVASLLTQTLGSLIMRQQPQPQTQTQTLFGPRPAAATLSGGSTGLRPGQKIRQRLGQVTKANAILNRRATSVGSLLFSGFIYGLSVLPALMAITGVNPLSGSLDTSASTTKQAPSRSSRKASGGTSQQGKQQQSADQQLQKMSESNSKVLLANLPYPYMMPVPFPPASSLLTAQSAAHESNPNVPTYSGSPDAADALLQPAIHSGDYSTQVSVAALASMGSFSDLHPLIDEPSSQLALEKNFSLAAHRYPQQHIDDDMEHSQWQDQSPNRRKVQRDLRNWQPNNQHNYDSYNKVYYHDKARVDNFAAASHLAQQQNNGQEQPSLFQPSGQRRPFQETSSSELTSKQQQQPMAQQSSNSQARFPVESDRPPSSNAPPLASSSSSLSNNQPTSHSANSDHLRDPILAQPSPKYVSPATNQIHQPPPPPSWSPEQADKLAANGRQHPSESNQYRPPSQPQPQLQIHGQQSSQQWQNHNNNDFPTSPTSPSSGSSLDFALLGPYEPFLALQKQPNQQTDERTLIASGSTRSRREPNTANLPYSNSWLVQHFKQTAPPDDGQPFAKLQQQPAADERPDATSRPASWSRSRDQSDSSGGQWRAITQPIMRSDTFAAQPMITQRSGTKRHKRRPVKKDQSVKRIGSATTAGGSFLDNLEQQQQLYDGPEIIVSRSMALSGEK